MRHLIEANNLRELYFKTNLHFFNNNNYDYQRGSVTAHAFEVMMKAKSPEGYLDFAEMGYSKRKWAALIKLYVDVDEWGLFLARLLHYKAKNKKYVTDVALQMKERRNRSGSCLQSIVIGYSELTGWRVTVFSRANEITLRWYADLMFLQVLLREVERYTGIPWKCFSVTWYASSIYQSITSMPLTLLLADKEYGTDKYTRFLNRDASNLNKSDWRVATILRFNKSYSADGAYHSFKTQRRPVEAYLAAIGELDGVDNTPADTLRLPIPSIDEYDEAFFKKGGMR